MLLLWSIFPALDAFLELCDHPKSHRLQQTLRSPANSAAKLGLPSAEATITERAELKQVEERLAIGADVVYETIRRAKKNSALAWSAFRGRLCFLIIAKSISWETYPTQFFIPTLLGVIGGFLLVAALGHAQVVGGKEEHTKAKV
jgi:hypothetical protein